MKRSKTRLYISLIVVGVLFVIMIAIKWYVDAIREDKIAANKCFKEAKYIQDKKRCAFLWGNIDKKIKDNESEKLKIKMKTLYKDRKSR